MSQQRLARRLTGWWLLAGSIAVLSFAGRAVSDSEPDRELFYRYDTAAFTLVLYALLLSLVLLIAAGPDVRELLALRRPPSWRQAGLMALGAFVTMWLAAVLLEQVFRAGEEQGLDPERLTVGRVAPFAVNFVVAAVVVPIVEELLYRGLGFSLLAQFGDTAAIVVTGFVFALSHGFVEGIPVFFVIGAALAFVRSRTGSIYPAILMHAFFNGTQLVLGAAA